MVRKILIIEGSQDCGEEIQQILNSGGYNAYIADGKTDGIGIALRYLPDLIICNLNDADEELRVVHELNNNRATESIPFFILSRCREISHARRLIEAGADDFIVMPAELREILKTVDRKFRKLDALKERLLETMNDSLDAPSTSQKKVDHVLVRIGSKLRLVEFSTIVLITALKEYTKITTSDGCKIVVRKSMRNWMDLLPPDPFLRIHRGTIINLDYLQHIQQTGPRTYKVSLKNVDEQFVLSQRFASVMRRTFPK